MSVSLNPKLVVISVSEKAQMLEKLKKTNKFAVNILSADQENLSMIFAGQKSKEDQEIDFETLAGIPVIKGALAQVTCDVVNVHIEGDHSLFIGNVTDIHIEDHEPLVYFNGSYRSLLTTEENV
jgi:flavin reductase (DIM6/NTAB) family NADH-FMN oxidoreductase RutF